MNIKWKVVGVVVPPLVLLAVVSLAGMINLRQIVLQLKHVAHTDVPLTSVLHNVATHTLEQEIWFERAVRAGEQGLSEEAASALAEFSRLGRRVLEELGEGRRIATASSGRSAARALNQEMAAVSAQLEEIQISHAAYMARAAEVFEQARRGQLSQASLSAGRVRLDEAGLNAALEQLGTRIERFTSASLEQALSREIRTATVMTVGLSIVMLFGFIAFPLLMLLW